MYTAYISYVLTIMVFILMLIILYLTFSFFFFNDPATTEIYTLSLHDALPISEGTYNAVQPKSRRLGPRTYMRCRMRSEEHTSELQSPMYLVCRLLLEKKKKKDKKKKVKKQYTDKLKPKYISNLIRSTSV